MIIPALCNYYDILSQDENTIPIWGYSKADVSFAMEISRNGELLHIVDLRGGDGKPRPQSMIVPLQASRSGKKAPPYFACDKAKYVLGIEKSKENDDSTILIFNEYFEAFRTLQHKILDDIDDPDVHGFFTFLDNWKPEDFLENPKTQEYKDTLLSSGVCIFRCGDIYLHQKNNVKSAWENYSNEGNKGKDVAQCLVSGKIEPIARVHYLIKGVLGAQPAGASIVSFNDEVFCSYGKDQSFNSPISEAAMFKYTTALKHLLTHGNNRAQVADSTVVLWAESNKHSGEDFIKLFLNSWEPESEDETEEESQEDSKVQNYSRTKQLNNIIHKIQLGKPLSKEDIGEDPDTMFYILGLSPNNGRLAIRFWYANTIEYFITRAASHYQDMEIIRDDYDSYYPQYVSVYDLLNETIPKAVKKSDNKDKKTVSPLLGGLTVRSILDNTIYPNSLYSVIMSRVKIEGSKSLNCVRAGCIKGYLLRLSRAGLYNVNKDLITVSLNEESSNVPYRLGRLFAVLVKVQAATNKTMNTTINDRYFSSAASTPTVVFPILLKLAQHHFDQLNNGLDVRYKKLMQEILWGVDEFPAYLNLEDQGMFMLGYYHQFKDMFKKKDETPDKEKEAKSSEKNTGVEEQ